LVKKEDMASSHVPPSCGAQIPWCPVIQKKLCEAYDDDMTSYMSHFWAYWTWLNEDACAWAVLVASMEKHWLERLFGLIMLLKCGPFFASTMSPLVSPLILPPYDKSSCYSTVTAQLRISFDSYLQYGVSLTLLVLNCLQTLVIPAGNNRATLRFVAPMTS
jgi:hypothetical protein